MRFLFKILKFLIVLIPFCLVVIYFCNKKVEECALNKLYTDVNEVPYNRVGLLLGTGKYLKRGAINPYYKYRIDAAAKLLKSGKIRYLVISGDNSRNDYNEPQSMKNDLYAAGIDSNLIYLDYAGFRTFDSMVRVREIFSQDSVTVISQQFHNERALYIASKENIVAVGFNARDVAANHGLKTKLREKLARVKVFVDYIIDAEPKFLGPKVAIGS
jgi:SanA protein